MKKFNVLLSFVMLFTIFNCTNIVDSNLDKNGSSYNIIWAEDGNDNGIADAYEWSGHYDENGDEIPNYEDTTYLKTHVKLDSIINYVPDSGSVDIPVEGKPYLSVSQPTYEIIVGGSFDPSKDIEFTAKDGDGKDVNSDVEFSGNYDVNTVGKYTITLSYSGLTKSVTLTVKEGEVTPPVPGEPYLSVAKSFYEITVGESFDPSKDIEFTAKDADGNDVNSDVEFSGKYDVDTAGEYTITLTYGELTKNVTLSVKDEGGVEPQPINNGKFEISIENDHKVNDTLIKIAEGLKLDPIIIIAKVKESGNDASVNVNNTLSTVEYSKTLTAGTYYRVWTVMDPDNSDNFITFKVTVKVTGETSVTLSSNPEKDEFTVGIGEYDLPTVESAFDGEKDVDPSEVVIDNGGYDKNTEGTYTVTYTLDGTVLRTLVITVSDVKEVVLTDDDKNTDVFSKMNGITQFIIPSGYGTIQVSHDNGVDVKVGIGSGAIESTPNDWGGQFDLGGETLITIDPSTSKKIEVNWW